MKRFIVFIIAFMVLFVGCSEQKGSEPQAKDQKNQQVSPIKTEQQENLDICEAVFRYQFKHNASGAKQNAKAYFLEILRKDPSPEFLARFKDNAPPVKKGSEFAIGKGLKFKVGGIKRLNDSKVEVSGGYYEGGLSSSGCTYSVVLKDKKWVVTERKMLWIS